MIIRKAIIEDAKEILSIASSNTLSGLSKAERKNGFLVSNFSLEDYEIFIEKHELFYVLIENDIVQAFLLAYFPEELDDTQIINKKIKEYAVKPYVVIKQICVSRSSANKGYASKLYEYFIEHVKKDIFLAVVLEPYNEASIMFHMKHRFEQLIAITAEDNILRGIFYRAYNKSISSYDKDIILTQYEKAIELYKHEDELNWSKMYHLFYVTAGLAALLSIILPMISGIMINISICILSLMGSLVSGLFYIAISNGINYMQRRKQSVIDIEQILIGLNGVKVVSSNFDRNDRAFRISSTTKVMRLIPITLGILWVLAFLSSIVIMIIK